MHAGRALAVVGLGLAALWFVAEDATAQVRLVNSPGAPIDNLWIDDQLGCQIHKNGEPTNGFYPGGTNGPADCGTFLALGTTVYRTNPLYASGGVTPSTFWTPVSFPPVSGAGTTASPYVVTTTVDAGTTGVTLTQINRYITTNDYYTTSITITNGGAIPQTMILYLAGDCYFGGFDSSYGFTRPTGGVGCSENPNGAGGGFYEWVPQTPGSAYYEAGYGAVWSWIGGRTMFPNTCTCGTRLDSGAGLSWQFTIPAGGTQLVESTFRYSNGSPQPDFVVEPYVDCSPVTVFFEDRTTWDAGTTAQSETWNFGDGTAPVTYTPPLNRVSHLYQASGTFTVSLTAVASNGGSATTSQDITICTYAPPEASFRDTPHGCAPVTVYFEDLSVFHPRRSALRQIWDFGDGSPLETQEPAQVLTAHEYLVPGTYTVTLQVVDNGGSTDTTSRTIRVCQVPTAAMGATLVSPCDTHNPLVQFTDLSTDVDGSVVQWRWNFGDGAIGTTRHPLHSYGDEPGTYTVTLGIVDSDGAVASTTGTLAYPGYTPCPVASAASRETPPTLMEPTDGRDQQISESDPDGDGVMAASDNCVAVWNPDQADTDGDGRGDACEVDADGDFIQDSADNCPSVANADQRDTDRDGTGDACDATPGVVETVVGLCAVGVLDAVCTQEQHESPLKATPLRGETDTSVSADAPNLAATGIPAGIWILVAGAAGVVVALVLVLRRQV